MSDIDALIDRLQAQQKRADAAELKLQLVQAVLYGRRREEYSDEEAALEIERIVSPDNPEKGILR